MAAVGTAIAFSKFIFLPFAKRATPQLSGGFWLAIALLVGALAAASTLDTSVYVAASLIKSLVTLAAGGVLYTLLSPRLAMDRSTGRLTVSASPERLDNIIGTMILMLLFLFWWVVP